MSSIDFNLISLLPLPLVRVVNCNIERKADSASGSSGPGDLAISLTAKGGIGTMIAESLVEVAHPSFVRQDVIYEVACTFMYRAVCSLSMA
jgi:hypothetical protein